MIAFLRNLAITQKITMMAIVTSATALVLASAGFLVYEVSRERDSTIAQLNTLGDMIAVNTTAALAFGDPIAAEETLVSLSVEPAVLSACVYDAKGSLFATYKDRPGVPECTTGPLDRAAADGSTSLSGEQDMLRIRIPVRRENERLGTVEIIASTVDIWGRLQRYSGIVAIVSVASGLVAFLLAVPLRRLISEPILRLTEAAHTVTATKDYSLRVPREGTDQIGTLVDAFNEMLDQIQARDRELQSFSYSVSHDLRGPLRGVHGLGQALVEDYGDVLDENARSYIDRMQAAVSRMDQLIEGLLRLSRVVRGEIRTEDVNLSEMAADVVAELRAQQPELSTDTVIAPGMIARGDRQLLRIVMDNLIQNAWKFTATQPRRRIEVGSRREGRQVIFFVRDNGVGFNMEKAQELFEPFRRLHPSAEFEGTGIGLATVGRIIGRHGGRIWAEADVGNGATFYFRL